MKDLPFSGTEIQCMDGCGQNMVKPELLKEF